MTTGSLVEARGLGWTVGGRTVLGPLDLALGAGETVVVVGPNGAGKTTLLRLITGVLAPTAGTLRWRGTPYRDLSRRRLARRIAYVPQLRPLDVPLSVGDLVLLGRFPHLGRLQLAPTAEDREAVREALARVRLERLAATPLDRLSGGERQLAHVAAALAQGGELLILDEPTAHLDPGHQRRILALLGELAGRTGRTLLVSTHEVDVAAHLASRVLALDGGRLLADGPPAEVLTPEVLAELFDAPFRKVGDEPGRLLLELPR